MLIQYENHGKSDISTGAVWMGTWYQDFFGNCLDGSRERYLHGNGKNIFPVKSWGKFPREFSRGKPWIQHMANRKNSPLNKLGWTSFIMRVTTTGKRCAECRRVERKRINVKDAQTKQFPLTRVTFRLWIATPKRDYTDKLLYHHALNQVSNSSDRELPRDMFRFKTV